MSLTTSALKAGFMNCESTTLGCKAHSLHSRWESTVHAQSPLSAQSGANSPRIIQIAYQTFIDPALLNFRA